MPTENDKHAPIKLHPAGIICLAILIVGAEPTFWQLRAEPNILRGIELGGRVLFLAGLAVLFFAYGAFAMAKTTIDPRKHTSKLVTGSLYAYSRNPIYLGWLILLVGISLEKTNGFQLLTSIFAFTLLHWAVVLKEEEYLERAFPQEYLSYKDSVRRWI